MTSHSHRRAKPRRTTPQRNHYASIAARQAPSEMTPIILPDETSKGWVPPTFLAVFQAPDRDLALQLLRELPILNIRSITEVGTISGSDLVQLQGPYHQHIPLTPRQEQILHFLEQGNSTKEIARSLQLSHFTVRNHITCILKAFGVHSRRELRRLVARDRTRYDAGRCFESHITEGFGQLR